MFVPIEDQCSGVRSCSVGSAAVDFQGSDSIHFPLQEGVVFMSELGATGGNPAVVGAAWSGEPHPAVPHLLLYSPTDTPRVTFSCSLYLLQDKVWDTFVYSAAILFPQ